MGKQQPEPDQERGLGRGRAAGSEPEAKLRLLVCVQLHPPRRHDSRANDEGDKRLHAACLLPNLGKRDGDTGNCSPAPYDALCTFEGVQDQLTQAYSTMAYVSQPAKGAPAGEAWRTYPGRNSLFANDGSHATCSGTFLAACTIFEQIWGVPCSASTYSPVGDAAALKEQADAIVAGGSSWSWPSNGPPCPGCIGMGRR